jgi:hypothetical protein
MTPVAKGVVTLGGETALLAAAVTVDIDPAAVLVGAGSLAGGAFLWVAQGWWKDWRDEETKHRAELKADLKAIRADLDAIKERHNREDGAAEAADRRHR